MQSLPVIIGFGGFNPSGRSSFHHGYRRTVLSSLSVQKRNETLLGLACMMQLVKWIDDDIGAGYINTEGERLSSDEVVNRYQSYIKENTLVRKIPESHFSVDTVPYHRAIHLQSQSVSEFIIAQRDIPLTPPENWTIEKICDRSAKVTISGDLAMQLPSEKAMEVQSAGVLPTGFNPSEYYASRFHPRGLQMSIMAASDAIQSTGIAWETIVSHVDPDQIAVFASSGLGQTDENGMGGYLQARLKSGRASSKQMALGLNSMPADFINAYVCGSVGSTSAVTGACASFLYNLRLASEEIKKGHLKIAICGCSEAPVTPEVIEAYHAMGALGSDERLKKLDDSNEVDHQRASRPFGDNCGFTLSESAQYFILMDDALAMQLGLSIYGAVPDVFINADGYKKSISSPGAGNYITLAKAVAAAQAIVGKTVIKEQSLVQAHGSSTPQNRITESMVLDKVAKAFDISQWKISAIKAYVGHPLGPASGDQLSNTLGIFSDGIIPGISTTSAIASDVVDERLDILLEDTKAEINVAFLNSKGFGGNNATAVVLSPSIVNNMLKKRYGDEAYLEYQTKQEEIQHLAKAYDQRALRANFTVKYHFGENVIEDQSITISADAVHLKEFTNPISLKFTNPYSDMV